MKVIASLILSAVLLSVPAQAQTQRLLGWDPSPQAERVLEYHVFRDGVFAGATAGETTRTFPFTIQPGETTTFTVYSYGWKIDLETGQLLGEAGVGDPSAPFVYTEPNPPPLPPRVTSPDGTFCSVGTDCQIVDAVLHVWTLDSLTWAILRDGVHYFGGVANGLLWFGNSIYAQRSDLNGWWVATSSGWEAYPRDPRSAVPPSPGPSCTWVDGTTYSAGATSPNYNVPIKQWSVWYAQRQLAGWTTQLGPNLTKNRKNYTGNLYCIGK